ncbi:DUF1549 and DUF1553 domain-containing protein [Tuwongella immobilis]|uniref:DUF1553 domain-containing protein n=1 Tax=Tuwongella immobilis TaxID=692036 RepID=A0A6C2YRM5_9BACT|nr:DUF1549 and DUF1553 domain-containing protein [Tuwongella immobilis]VIP04310.1 Uncharacterized protein OS=Solibacter usitatus (strain Ellin6076) GN=Acid_1145 PE=4 SV=1: PSCyt2: PSD1 [Tuwongella immobilis]VTS05983.1 Uncharacterized protein OS=Solibacter usitatus (strain Ellin6076) GN=Acid_1145 PE=4 SV=1: PSCyt2: PSD1 [Tuwongella immobilis]
MRRLFRVAAVGLLGLMFAHHGPLRAIDPPSSELSDDWVYEGLRDPKPPVVPANLANRVRNPIDAFLLAELGKKGLSFRPDAAPATLIRRITFDLTGLPPTPEEVAAFVTDPSDAAYEKLVDRLMASPHYGERMAQSWLDLVRFAETDGFKQDDPRPGAWLYRDYVIQSFQNDKPYDRFIQEQLAGDEMFPGDSQAAIATGMNRHYPDEYNAVNLEQRRIEILTDITDTVGSAVMGLTIGCARCHDHKFDPILQSDYFRIQAFFAGWGPVDQPVFRNADEKTAYEKRLQEWNSRTASLQAKQAELEKPYLKSAGAKSRQRFDAEYAKLLDLEPNQMTPLQIQIRSMIRNQVVNQPKANVPGTMKAPDKEAWTKLQQEMEAVAGPKPAAPPKGMMLTDVGPVAPVTHILRRGNWQTPGKVIEPGFLSAIDDRTADITPTATTTGRRKALALWLTQPDQPLTTRTIVNRLWQHHFGVGIVGTPNDLGVQGDRPTHVELLDWLARELVRQKWSLKAMHRMMVLSSAYRQASTHDAKSAEVDSGNALLWRQNRQRLDGESIRDAILAVTGKLNRAQGGPGVFPEVPADLKAIAKDWPVSKNEADRNRRSVYVFVKRNLRYPLFSLFDAPDRTETCGRRFVTTSAPQALMLLNDRLILQHAKDLASRVLTESGNEPSGIVDRAVRLCYSRAPMAEESHELQTFLKEQSVRLAATFPDAKVAFREAVVDLCHALLNTNEFLTID